MKQNVIWNKERSPLGSGYKKTKSLSDEEISNEATNESMAKKPLLAYPKDRRSLSYES